MKYKVGDRVRIKSIDWYNKSERNGNVYLIGWFNFIKPMADFCGKIATIKEVQSPYNYRIFEDGGIHYYTDEMIEGLVEEEEIEFTEEDKYWCDIMSESDPTTYVLPQGYQFVDENGNVINAQKIVLEKKKKEVILTQEQIDTMVHESCVLFCKHCGCGVPRETCTSLGTCKEHDEYRAAIRTHLMEKNKKEYPKTYKALATLASRLAESVLMDWDKEEQVRLAKEVATKCHEIFNKK